MSVLEKQAWFILIVFSVTLLLFGGSILIFGWHEGMFGFSGLAGGAQMIGRRERKAGQIIHDERDTEIDRQASLAGYSIFWVIFVFTTMTPFFRYGPDHIVAIKASHLCFTIIIAMMILFFARSLTIITLYRRPNHG